ncbi:hypothetical protein [Dysgonomonas sp. 25]|uniref:hypothetical protein n=1 Tax=Dysgonomonas sp. 25 TaxID=2302933 RepID=UPI0013D5DC54|nr:hypothetical protein [Dysgonomonas sp. 25]NDV69920.1 hypothetical protein [Dysgonomonas sp. 25]
MRKIIFSTLSTLLLVLVISFYNCSSDETLSPKGEPQKAIADLENLYSKMQNKDISFIDSCLIAMESKVEEESSIVEKTTTQKENEYLDKYIQQESSGNYSFVGNVNFDEIIYDNTLSIEEREFLIVTLSSLEYIEEVFQEKNVINNTKMVNSCLDTYRSELTSIRNRYLGGAAAAWGLYLVDKKLGLSLAFRVAKKAFAGEHYIEIADAEARYNACI